MIRRAIDEKNKYRRMHGRRKAGYTKLEGFILILPVAIIVFAFGLMFYALRFQAESPVSCPRKSEIAYCHPESVTVGVLSPHGSKHKPHIQTALNSWIRVARDLGMRVVFFGNDDPDLPSISIDSSNDIDFMMKSLQWLKYRYGSSSRWFVLLRDHTFLHPYYLMTELICTKDPDAAWYIGHRGSVPDSAALFASSSSGFVLSSSSLSALVSYWTEKKCSPIIADDVTIGNCMYDIGVGLTPNPQFMKNYEHHYLKPLVRFVTCHSSSAKEVENLNERFFSQCNF
jgi:hypothetical protein